FNFEDGRLGTTELHSIADQAARLRDARAAADATLRGVFINARTDIFLKANANSHSDRMVDHALERAQAYAQAGADGFFVPGLIDPAKIARICKECPLPVNVMASTAMNVRELASLGVARVSYGPHPYRLAIAAVREGAGAASGGAGTYTLAGVHDSITRHEFQTLNVRVPGRARAMTRGASAAARADHTGLRSRMTIASVAPITHRLCTSRHIGAAHVDVHVPLDSAARHD